MEILKMDDPLFKNFSIAVNQEQKQQKMTGEFLHGVYFTHL